MKPSLFELIDIKHGKLFIMPRPSTEYLIEDLRHYKNMGIDVVISLLEKAEAYDLGLSKEAEQTEAIGLSFFQFPIKDRSIPTQKMVRNIMTLTIPLLESGKNIAIHCRAGIGRSGLIACCILMYNGYRSDDAMSLVSSARGIPIPDTSEQIDFIYDFEYLLRLTNKP
jgi:protein-tyrosine phosphatase